MKIIIFFIISLMFVIQTSGTSKYNHKLNSADSDPELMKKTSSLLNTKYSWTDAYQYSEAMFATEITVANRLVDGSFESWNNESKTPAGMSTFANGDSFTYEHSNDAKVGAKSFKAVSASTKESYTFSFTNVARNSGDKIYFGAWIKTSKRISSGYLSDHSGYMTVPTKSHTWEWCSYITSSTETKTGLQFRLNKPNKQVGDYIMLDGVYYLNLTQIFGAGAEPDILDVDMFVRNHIYFNASDPQAINNFKNLIETYKETDVIFQARQTRLFNNILRVGTYNTKNEFGIIRFNLARKIIADMDLDLLGLQEITEPYDQSKSVNTLISNFNLSYSHHYPIPRTTYDYGEVGIGIGSAFPLINPTNIPDDYNGCIKTVVKLGGKNVSFYNTHLKVPANNAEAKIYIDKLWNNIISKDTSDYIIVAADFNAPKGTADLGVFQSFLNNGFTSAQGDTYGWYSTIIASENRWIDNVLVKGFKILNTGIKYPSVASDHNAFWAEIQMITDSKINQTPPVLKNVPADKNLGHNPKLPSCDANVTATGGCSDATVACTPGVIIKEGCNRSQTFTYTATDACGNKATATTTYTWIEDLTPPVLANVPANKDLGNNPELPTCDTKVTASDQCSKATVVCTPGTIIKNECKRSQTFTYTATDASGNKATATTTYTWIEDLTPPVLANVPAHKDLGNNPELPTCDSKVTASDQCGDATVVCTPGTIIKDGCKRSQTFTYTATDASGNEATVTTTYTWTEDLKPLVLANVPADKNLGNNPELPTCDAKVTASDQCDDATVVCTPGTIIKDGCKRSQTFTYTATDASGNEATATTTYTWTEDLTPLVLANIPADKNLGNNPELPGCDAAVTAVSQCSEATVTCTPGTIIKDECTRSQTFTYSATDASGNEATATNTYTWIEDLTPPVLANVPVNRNLGHNPELPGCNAAVTAIDQCSEVTVACTPGTILKDGNKRIQTFMYSAIDACGNETTATTIYTWTEGNNAPVADFAATENILKKGETVQIEDLSNNDPISWSWKFEGGTPETSSLKNPEVRYDIPGNYSVTLKVANAAGSDTKTIENFIIVEENLNPDELVSSDTQISGQFWFKLYPNPVVKNLVIEMIETTTGDAYVLFDVKGRKLKTDKILSERTIIDLSEQVPGVYILVLEKSDQIFRELIVKQ
jgi:PKD repeat protein/endonuclease/exonuclease/phosphatase family metal-dependent hydrolase